jgi:hypothetical protein
MGERQETIGMHRETAGDGPERWFISLDRWRDGELVSGETRAIFPLEDRGKAYAAALIAADQAGRIPVIIDMETADDFYLVSYYTLCRLQETTH